MQLKNTYLITILLFGLSVSTVASCSQTSSINLKWEQTSANEVIIDAYLPSGVEVQGIRYSKDKLSKKWLLQLSSTSGIMLQSGIKQLGSLPMKDFNSLFSELVSFIEKNYNGQLDRVHIGLGLITELWEDTTHFLRQGAVPSNYKLKPKDLNLAKKISSHLATSSILKMLCDEAMQIQKVCKNNFIDMNPITFEPDYIGKEWSQVETLPNTGISTDKLWFGLSLSSLAKQ